MTALLNSGHREAREEDADQSQDYLEMVKKLF